VKHANVKSLIQMHVFVRSLAVLTYECSETCIMAMHVVSQDVLISIAQFDLDKHQNISSPVESLHRQSVTLSSLSPYIKQCERSYLHLPAFAGLWSVYKNWRSQGASN
jgi:hypothetical protein